MISTKSRAYRAREIWRTPHTDKLGQHYTAVDRRPTNQARGSRPTRRHPREDSQPATVVVTNSRTSRLHWHVLAASHS